MHERIPEVISVPGSAVKKLISAGDGDAALLYLFLSGEGLSAAEKLPWSAERFDAANQKLSELGLTPGAEAPKPAKLPPIEKQTEKKFYSLTQEVQRLFGRILSSDELVRLFGIYETLGMPPEVILQLVVYCAAETQGRVPAMKYIEKAAYTWEREGIKTLEHAEKYIKERTEKKQESAKIKTALQIHDRGFTPTERKYVDAWLALGFTAEVIAIAYDRTVTKTGKLSWGYMNSIISSWHGKNLFTVEDILAKDTRQSTAGRVATAAAPPDDSEVQRINRIISSLTEPKEK